MLSHTFDLALFYSCTNQTPDDTYDQLEHALDAPDSLQALQAPRAWRAWGSPAALLSFIPSAFLARISAPMSQATVDVISDVWGHYDLPDGDQNARLLILPERSTKFICFQPSITFLKQLWTNCWRCWATYAHLLIKADERLVQLPVNLNEAQSMTCVVNYYYLLMYYCTYFYLTCYYLLLMFLLLHGYYNIITHYYIFHKYVLLPFLLLYCYCIIITYYCIFHFYILL